MNPVLNQTPELSDEFVDRHHEVVGLSADQYEENYNKRNVRGEEPRYIHDIDLIHKAFKEMRKQGMIAVQNYGFSSSEGGGMIGERLDEKFEQGKKLPIGVAWYSTQAGESRFSDNILWVNYDDGHAPADPDKKCPYTQTEVGVIICEILANLGIPFEWNGKPSRAIGIHLIDTQEAWYVAKMEEYEAQVEAEKQERERKYQEDTLRARIWRLENEIAQAKEQLKEVAQ